MQNYQVDNLIAITGSFVVVLTVTLLVLRAWRRAFEARHELRRQLLDKLTSEALLALLENPESRRSLAVLVGESDGAAAGMGRGATLILAGLALGIAGAMARLPFVGIAALVAVAAGIGQLVAAWLAAREARRARQ